MILYPIDCNKAAYNSWRWNRFSTDVYDDLTFIEDLWLRVYPNTKKQTLSQDFEVAKNVNGIVYVRFYQDQKEGDVVSLKSRSARRKNENGFYEIPYSLERKSKNENIKEFTLGEVIDLQQ